VYYWSSTYNDIGCLAGFFFCISHPLVIFLSFSLIKGSVSEEEDEANTNIK